MATPASAPPGGVSASSNPGSRWGRSGEPGSAFNGLSRPGRGGRGRGGARGGRGGSRGTPSNKESKAEDDHRPSNKPDNPPSAPIPAAKPSGSSSLPPADKPNTPASKPKPSSRRASRVIPPVVNTQIQSIEVSSAPASAKPPHKRRHSQAGKHSGLIPGKINPPAPNDNLLRPNKPRLAPVPHTAPIKDTPPHLNQRFDMRNDIDALVERVRAVAMDNNRPSTPGSHSHIDWAGDDDDSLPDLDDWGVTPATFAASKSDVISPLIVGGLKPLPDITANSIPPSPLKQQVTPPAMQEPHEEQDTLPTPVASAPPVETLHEQAKPPTTIFSPKAAEVDKSSPPSTKPAFPISDSSSRKPLHPSLPAKPVTAPPVSQLKLRPGATPMRNSPYPKSPISATKDSFKANPTSEKSIAAETHVEGDTQDEKRSPTPLYEKPTQRHMTLEDLTIAEPASPDPVILEVSSAMEPTRPTTKADPVDAANDSREGLAASIHAPKAIADSVSAPATISSYSDFSLSSEHHVPTLTHTRAHTVGRPPSFPKHQNEYIPRFSRSGQSTPRGGFQGNNYHARTHSSPPAGALGNQPRAHRPVITGDAISRLARTIGKTGISSSTNNNNSKPQPIGSLGS